MPQPTTAPALLDVPVVGGVLRCARWGPAPGSSRATLLAAHGITSSWRFFPLIGEAVAAAGATLLAPDLRGRGDSAELPGPWGMGVHARDLIAVLDHLDVARAVLVGHSMGGFAVAVAAALHPQRAAGVLLVDGGLALTEPLDADADVDAILGEIIGPALQRLTRRFSSREEHRAFWRDHPAFAEVPAALVDAYADHDLTGRPPRLRSRVDAEAVRADAADTLLSEQVRTAALALPVPAVFLCAERGMLDGPDPLYPTARVAALAPDLPSAVVAGSNHYSIGLSRRGAAVVAARALDLCEEAA